MESLAITEKLPKLGSVNKKFYKFPRHHLLVNKKYFATVPLIPQLLHCTNNAGAKMPFPELYGYETGCILFGIDQMSSKSHFVAISMRILVDAPDGCLLARFEWLDDCMHC
jgi:hypothetical protein